MNNSIYSTLPTAELVEKIANHSDAGALDEFLSHRKLIWQGGMPYLLPEYLWELRQKRFAPYLLDKDSMTDEKVDLLYDRLLQKFSILKPNGKEESGGGPYCNQQYVRLHQKICQAKARHPEQSQFEMEIETGRFCRNLAISQIGYCWMEVRRILDESFSRYRLMIGAKYLELRRPRWMKGRDFRQWLDEHIVDLDLNHKKEKERVQKMVYDTFGFQKKLSLEEAGDRDLALASHPDPTRKSECEYLALNLYDMIADEKAASLHEQRPAIRKLGKEGLRRLVKRILNEYVDHSDADIAIAKEFNLSKATFSRFAGKDWKKNVGNRDLSGVPDLWRNMAQVICRDPHFVQAAARLGVKDIVDMLVSKKGS